MFSVGVLYSCHGFLELIKKGSVNSTSFPEMFQTFEVSTAESVLQAAQLCEWVTLGPGGQIYLSKRGAEILEATAPDARLRIQLRHMIASLHPPWVALLSAGRREAEKSLPPAAHQCFKEAGLLSGYDSHTLEWWDAVAAVARLVKETSKRDSGRLGETYSIAFELDRVGVEPYWQGFESNFAGYDLLSQLDRTDRSRVLIEVKASYAQLRDGLFFLSRHEWDVAVRSSTYIFHLWTLRPSPRLFVASVKDMVNHVPTDAGTGEWKQVLIPVSPFGAHEVPVTVGPRGGL